MEAQEPPVVNIAGDLVALGPLRRDLLPLYTRWMNDLVVPDRLGLPALPMTEAREETWYDWAATTTDWANFTVYERAAWRPVGTCGLGVLDHRHGTAEVAILIGAPADRGRGFGTEAVRLLLDYAFTALGLHNVLIAVDAANPAGLRAYLKAGFKEVGRRREAIRTAGRRTDEVILDCLASEFASPVLAVTFPPADRG